LILKELIDFKKLVQEISIDYFIRLGACQGKFFGWIKDTRCLPQFSKGNRLSSVFSVSSINFLFTSWVNLLSLVYPNCLKIKGLSGDFIFAHPFEGGAWLWLVGIQSLDTH
jgi:hypothetical protein